MVFIDYLYMYLDHMIGTSAIHLSDAKKKKEEQVMLPIGHHEQRERQAEVRIGPSCTQCRATPCCDATIETRTATIVSLSSTNHAVAVTTADVTVFFFVIFFL